MEILGVKYQNWRKRGMGLILDVNAGKPANTGVLRGANASTKRREKSSL
jgi:hypothetical protein